ncbi:hypothetical protein IWX90DRAFT_300219 [Phyllosticta citrichinensis]|uniref:FHA domain-containing protein n=1 Tax=Phyllosticta citrichinensis TaxID=1130410 RepID=A0ABR1XKZ6_9PEZI
MSQSPVRQNGLSADADADASPSRPPPDSTKPSLLPPFEPLSSSPIARPPKRKYDDGSFLPKADLKYYPTPMPTSSTGILPSSPTRRDRSALHRTMSSFSERNPLCDVPSIQVPATGEPLLMGRSSNSSHHQLSANRLISRVHVRAVYHPPNANHASGQIVIECMGWNGAKVHCRGRVYELTKGDTFASDMPSKEIMLDVLDSRVFLAWPVKIERRASVSAESDTTWNEESPTKKRASRAASASVFPSSPPAFAPRSPASLPVEAAPTAEETFLASDPAELDHPTAVHVFEDGESGDERAKESLAHSQNSRAGPSSQESAKDNGGHESQDSDFSDHDEENDPIVHSFGPYGENILSRIERLSHNNTNSRRRRRPLGQSGPGSPVPQQGAPEKKHVNESPIKNHVINQLAFSRLHSMPLSTIFNNLPSELRGPADESRSRRSAKDALQEEQNAEVAARLTGDDLQSILDNIPCIGEINRVGKDASGKALENEYYYMPEMDDNNLRRDAVVGGIGGTGLRSVRKAHKQYYWKRPRN